MIYHIKSFSAYKSSLLFYTIMGQGGIGSQWPAAPFAEALSPPRPLAGGCHPPMELYMGN